MNMDNNESSQTPVIGKFLFLLIISCIVFFFTITMRPDFIYLTENKVLSREFTKAFSGKEFISIHVNCTYYYPIVEYRSKEHFIMTDGEDRDFVRKQELCLLKNSGFDGSSYKIIKNKGDSSDYRVLTTGEEMEREYSDSLVKTLLRAADFADDSIKASNLLKAQEKIKNQKVADSWKNVH